MRIKEELARLQLQNLEDLVRTIVREEIAKAFGALAREAEHQDMPYETGELEASALRVLKSTAEGTVTRLTCEHGEYNTWRGETRCDKCGEPEEVPANPFEGKEGSRG